MKHRGLKFLSLLLTLVLMLMLMPGMSLTAYAADPSVTIMPTGSGQVEITNYGDVYEFSATPEEGYAFAKWTYISNGQTMINAENRIYLDRFNVDLEEIHSITAVFGYPLWVGNTQVTSENASDILGNGTAKYDANTKTLTLTNASISDIYDEDANIYAENINLTIVLEGKSSLSSTCYGIHVSGGNLSIEGSGELAVTATGRHSGIYADSVFIKSCTVNVSAKGNSAIWIGDGNGTISISGNSHVIARSDESYGLEAAGSITIANSVVSAEAKNLTPVPYAGIYASEGPVTISNSTVDATGKCAIDSVVKNDIPGIGWTNMEGTEGQATIAVSTDGQDLSTYKKVQFEAADSFTVTYAPGNGARLNPDAIDGLTIVNGNIVRTVTADNASTYKVESFDSYFIAPEGQVFDKWMDKTTGTAYRNHSPLPLTGDITLTATWKEPGSGNSSSGSGGVDLVFNIPGADNSWEYAPGYAPQQAYRVSLAPMQGGSAALGLTTGDSGTALNVYPTSAVYVFPNADPGYTLDKIVWSLIDGSASYDITEAKNFVMPAMDVVVYVTFKPVG